MKFGIVLDGIFQRHITPTGHPERPERIASILKTVQSWEHFDQLIQIPPTPARKEWIDSIHTQLYWQTLKNTSGQKFTALDPDTSTSPESFEIALLAAGSGVRLVQGVAQGTITSGFAAVRPPGHHAERNRAMGFCLFNNVAIAAEFAIRNGAAERVAIIDFDVHHGNGTQKSFYARSDVLYLSTHQYPFYPGTGHFSELGEGAGLGFTLNFPLRAGTGDYFYCSLFEELVVPIVEQFEPELILVSAGYDAHHRDPLAGMSLTTAGFGILVNLLSDVAQKTCQGRILFLLEGGYHLKALSEAVLTTISTSIDEKTFQVEKEQVEDYHAYRNQIRTVFSDYWRL